MPQGLAWYLGKLPNDQAMAFWEWLAGSPDAREEMLVGLEVERRWRIPKSIWEAKKTATATEPVASACVSVELLSPTDIQECLRLRERMERGK